jgi:hypothetical protein
MCEPEIDVFLVWALELIAVAAIVIVVVATLHCEYCDVPENSHSNYSSNWTSYECDCLPHLPHRFQLRKLFAAVIAGIVNAETIGTGLRTVAITFAVKNIAEESKKRSGLVADLADYLTRNLLKSHCYCDYFAETIVGMLNLVMSVAKI